MLKLFKIAFGNIRLQSKKKSGGIGEYIKLDTKYIAVLEKTDWLEESTKKSNEELTGLSHSKL